jgi:transcriptional regulator with XRE-family HTH domain
MDQTLGDAFAVGQAIRDGRTRLRLNQESLARRIGVGRMTVSRLERGEEVSMATALDALRVCGLTVTASRTRGWMTAAEHAAAVADALAGEDHDFALRLVRQALDDLAYLDDRGDTEALAEFFAEIPSTGDDRWDRFLTLAIQTSCDRRDIPRPDWPDHPRPEEPFFPSRPSRRFIERTVERTTSEFADANIWIDEHDLSYA